MIIRKPKLDDYDSIVNLYKKNGFKEYSIFYRKSI